MRPAEIRHPKAVEISPHAVEPAHVRKHARALSAPFMVGVGVLALISIYFTFLQSQYNMYTYNLCLLAVLGALSLNLLMGTVGQASIGNAAFIAVGAFATAFLDRAGVPMPLDILIAALITGVIGLIVGFPALRIRGLYLVLATLAAYFIVIYVATVYQTDTVGGAGFQVTVLFQSRGLVNGQRLWIWLLTAIVGLVLLGLRCIDRGRVGRAWRFIRDHEVAAPAVGINVPKYKLGAFWLSSVLLGFEGSLLAHFNGSVTVDAFPLSLSIAYVAMVLIGGLDSMLGAVIGAGLVTALPIVVPQIFSSLANGTGSSNTGADLATVVYGLLIIFFMTRSPRGVAGWLETLAQKGIRLRRRRVTATDDVPA
jgi:branched-chain amino acid transport system permease protein